MNTTAGELIRDTLIELTEQSEEQSIPAVEFNAAVRYLNRMMAAWDALGIRLGYSMVKSASDVLTVPAGAIEGMMYNLAPRLATGYGIAVSAEITVNAQESMKAVRKLGQTIKKQNFSGNLPIGSGNEGTGGAFDTRAFFPDCCEDQNECCDDNYNPDGN